MTTGDVKVREARAEDFPALLYLAEASKEELGRVYLHERWLEQEISHGEVFVAETSGGGIGGFVVFDHHRHTEDEHTTVLYICTDASQRRRGIGKLLMEAVAADARLYSKRLITLKCPAHLPANYFYRSVGCRLRKQEISKEGGLLNLWELPL